MDSREEELRDLFGGDKFFPLIIPDKYGVLPGQRGSKYFSLFKIFRMEEITSRLVFDYSNNSV